MIGIQVAAGVGEGTKDSVIPSDKALCVCNQTGSQEKRRSYGGRPMVEEFVRVDGPTLRSRQRSSNKAEAEGRAMSGNMRLDVSVR